MRQGEYSIGVAKVTSLGISFRGIYYSNRVAIKEGWFEKVRWLSNWTVVIMYNPNNMNTVYVVDRKKNCVIPSESIELRSKYVNY
ncbi:Mu transposase C-terminal domain-containing protein [Paenibacillus sp. DMB5]|uniref:Mu transposase C-terminal domain-containing protein n=1 Tax=Paenibacillus sp. DMB5 TaxID=1780103 RepID=UPI00076D35E3|nr:Mu transposase C-terminal domain-containing protein [Paenibacillus sp. DMB5]KUP25934.1 hypothetical protein AWJ19_33500 [Paenibacillus sp. DMB5]